MCRIIWYAYDSILACIYVCSELCECTICFKAAGIAPPSFVANLLETCKSEDDHTILKAVAATAYGGMYLSFRAT
jgi:hypothetical protein